jgi:predicted nucleic acid-binding Zn ribbon protein
MPIHDYECKCGKKSEILVLSISNVKDMIECPECKQPTMRRVKYSPDSNYVVNYVGAGWPGQDMKLADAKARGQMPKSTAKPVVDYKPSDMI